MAEESAQEGVDSGGRASARGPEEFLREVVAVEFGRQIQALRGQIEGLEHELAEREAAEASIAVVVTGDGGGRWFLNVSHGRMEVARAPAYPVLFSIHQTHEDWRAFSSSGSMLGGAGPASGSALGEVGTPSGSAPGIFTSTRIGRLRCVGGTLSLLLRGGEPEVERRVTLHFGPGEPAEPPQVTVSMRAEDARRLREGSLDPQGAFLHGLVRISGDMSLAIQVGTALLL